MTAQERRPLAARRQIGRALENLHQRRAIGFRQGHEEARHQREVKVHVNFVAVAEVGQHIFRPLIGFGQQHRARRIGIDEGAQPFEISVRLRQVLAVGAFAFIEIRRRIDADAVCALIDPELHHAQHGFLNFRIVVVQIGLVMKEAMPVVLPAQRIERPVRRFGIDEDDARVLILLIGVAPHVPVAVGGVIGMLRIARRLKPRMLIRGVIGDQFHDDAQVPAMRFRRRGGENRRACRNRDGR